MLPGKRQRGRGTDDIYSLVCVLRIDNHFYRQGWRRCTRRLHNYDQHTATQVGVHAARHNDNRIGNIYIEYTV